ncbi:MAG: glycosyltransferase family 4 protein [Oscillospiraceae bacterium]
MKVLLFTKMFPRNGNDNFGSYVYDQVKAMNNQGVEIYIVSPHLYVPKICSLIGGKLKTYANAPHIYNYRGLDIISPDCFWIRNVIHNPEIKYKAFKTSIKRSFIAECNKIKPDIIYSLDPTMEGRLAVELKNELNIPVVLIEHSMRKFYNDLYGIGQYENIYKDVVNSADAMIYVSGQQKHQFEEITGKILKSYVVLNGFVAEDKNIDHKILDGDTVKLICIGYLEERKGYPILLKVMKYLKERSKHNYILTIIGDGIQRDNYEHKAVEYGIDGEVVFKGIIPHKQVFEELSKSDVFVLPSYGEALGISYLEAMNCGLPVIGTVNEGISDIVKSGENGLLVDKGDVFGVYQAIEYFANNKEQAKKMAEKGKDAVKELTWEKNAQKMLNIFKDILKDEVKE